MTTNRLFGAAAPAKARLPQRMPQRLFGSAQALAGGSGNSSTMFGKFEAEAPFYRVRLTLFNNETNPSTGFKAVVAATETPLHDTQNNRYAPVVGGAVSNVLADGNNRYGWRSVTWGGAALGNLAAATGARQTITRSDWINCPSVPRTDGKNRPYLLVRVAKPTGGSGNTSTQVQCGTGNGYFAWQNAATGNNGGPEPFYRDAMIYQANDGVDSVANLGTMPSVDFGYDNWPFLVAVEFDYGVYTRTVMCIGDSTFEGGGGQIYGFDNWLLRACLSKSTPAAPIVPYNGGMSSQTTATFYTEFSDLIAAGIVPTDVIFLGSSVNDSASFYNNTVKNASLLTALDLCYQNGIRAYVATQTPVQQSNYPGEYIREDNVATVRQLCAAGKATLVDFAAVLGQGISPDRWKTGLNQPDGIHPSLAGIQLMAATFGAVL